MLTKTHLITLNHLKSTTFNKAVFINELLDVSVKYTLTKVIDNIYIDKYNVTYNYKRVYSNSDLDYLNINYMLTDKEDQELLYINHTLYKFLEQILEEFRILCKVRNNLIINISSCTLNSVTLVVTAEVFDNGV